MSALAQVATQSSPATPPTMTAALGNTKAIVDIAQSTAIATSEAIQPLASSLLSPCNCQCMCPSAGFPLAANLSAVVATPETQMSTFQSMASMTGADQASLQSSTVQPATTGIIMTQQADMASSATLATSTPAVTALAHMASPAADLPAPQPGAANATSITPSLNPLSGSRTTMAAEFNINTYSLSSAVTAPIVLEI